MLFRRTELRDVQKKWYNLCQTQSDGRCLLTCNDGSRNGCVSKLSRAVSIEHGIDLRIFIQKVIWNMNLSCQQTEFALSPGFMRHQYDERQVVLCNNHLFTLIGHINQFRQVSFGFRYVDNHGDLLTANYGIDQPYLFRDQASKLFV